MKDDRWGMCGEGFLWWFKGEFCWRGVGGRSGSGWINVGGERNERSDGILRSPSRFYNIMQVIVDIFYKGTYCHCGNNIQSNFHSMTCQHC